LQQHNVSSASPCSVHRRSSKRARTAETNAMRGGEPGAHVDLNMSNEQYLDRVTLRARVLPWSPLVHSFASAGLNDCLTQDNFVGADMIVPHDAIHEAVKYYHKPMFESFKRDKT
jgi:hypothetical protein